MWIINESSAEIISQVTPSQRMLQNEQEQVRATHQGRSTVIYQPRVGCDTSQPRSLLVVFGAA